MNEPFRSSARVPLVEARAISKAFPGVRALADVDFDVCPGEVHVLLGENGAGKSTLVKILSGVYRPDGGTLSVGGEPVEFAQPIDALRAGIATVYQEFNLAPYMTVAENVLLGHEPRRAGFVDRRARRRQTAELIAELDIELDPDVRIADLGVAHRQMVEILKALAVEGFRVLIMDEPTAALSRREIDVLFRVIRRLRERGVGIVYISHRMEEIDEIGDRLTVFRDGHLIATRDVGTISADEIIELMVGRSITQLFPDSRGTPSEPALGVTGLALSSGRVVDASFTVHRGEIVGLFGLVGAGRTETLRAVFGLERAEHGMVQLFGKQVSVRSPKQAVGLGLGLAPEERKREGILPDMSIADNIWIASLDKIGKGPFVSPAAKRRHAKRFVDAMNIVAPSVRTRIGTLSGGNQQKCILARLLAADTEVLLLDEPTRGIDVGAKAAVYELIADLAARGKAILLVSSDLVEVMGISDRIIVFRKGRAVSQYKRGEATEQAIMRDAVPESIEAEERPPGAEQRVGR